MYSANIQLEASLYTTGCSLNIVFFFPRILESLPPLPLKHSAAIGCTKNYQPMWVSVHSHCVESFEGRLQRCRRGKGCSEFWKNTTFPEHPVHNILLLILMKRLPAGWYQAQPGVSCLRQDCPAPGDAVQVLYQLAVCVCVRARSFVLTNLT